MKVAMCLPESPEGLAELEEKVAVAHAQAIVNMLQKLTCPKEQKLRLLELTKSSFSRNVNT